MSHHSRRSTAGLLAILAGVFASSSGSAQQRVPPRIVGPAMRVLLVQSGESDELSAQVARFGAALDAYKGYLVRARTLDEADAIVQFTRRHRTFNTVIRNGMSEDWWEGHYVLLRPGREMPITLGAMYRLKLLVIGREPEELEPVLDALARTLAKGLGREARSRKNESI